ncbi:MAG: coproporphyrinogen dehydrogenase HemZ [Oscillospiraceae bacterium]|jgi:oxygen-independent coproporphyrinogen-3 oxidase|nr:coproporphyrinogen dehydrogenase HemZ [Oscillospiraceae bacterium]
MKIILSGHSYKYAAEQMLLQTLPGERPEFADEIPEGGDYVLITLCEADSDGAAYVSARLSYGGEIYSGRAVTRRIKNGAPGDILRERARQNAVKLAFFRAARRAARADLPWGATTGIRPSIIVTRMLGAGMTEKAAAAALRREYYVSPERAELALDSARAEAAARRGLTPEDAALYIGIPFCPTRCAYCSFVSQSVEKSMKLLPPFLDALKREAGALADVLSRAKTRVAAVYVGGGTPTTPDAGDIDDLLSHLGSVFDLSALREYTVEAGRPDTITAEKLAVLKNRGVTRISVNPQTMSGDVLRAIGRRHAPEDTYAAFALARAAGFRAVNMDLIAGLPGDSARGFKASLDAVTALGPENITVHTLSLKRGARVTLESTPVPSGGEVSDMLDYAFPALRGGGYSPYYLYRQKFTSGGFENTGWTLPGNDCLYNIIMMDEIRPVLALGSGVTKLVAPPGPDGSYGRIERIFNPKYPREYIERLGAVIEKKRRVGEFLTGNGQ